MFWREPSVRARSSRATSARGRSSLPPTRRPRALSVGNSVPRDEQGLPLRVNGVHIDISEMKGLQVALQHRYEELQRLQGLRDGLAT
jgi:hypothetical protein